MKTPWLPRPHSLGRSLGDQFVICHDWRIERTYLFQPVSPGNTMDCSPLPGIGHAKGRCNHLDSSHSTSTQSTSLLGDGNCDRRLPSCTIAGPCSFPAPHDRIIANTHN